MIYPESIPIEVVMAGLGFANPINYRNEFFQHGPLSALLRTYNRGSTGSRRINPTSEKGP